MTNINETFEPALRQIINHIVHSPLFPHLVSHKARTLRDIASGEKPVPTVSYLSLEFRTEHDVSGATLDLCCEWGDTVNAANGDEYEEHRFEFSVTHCTGGTRGSIEEILGRGKMMIAVAEFALKLQQEFTGNYYKFRCNAEEAAARRKESDKIMAEGQVRALLNSDAKKGFRAGQVKTFATLEGTYGLVEDFSMNDNARTYRFSVGPETTTVARVK